MWTITSGLDTEEGAPSQGATQLLGRQSLWVTQHREINLTVQCHRAELC